MDLRARAGELKEQRKGLVAKARAVIEAAEKDGRANSDEEKKSYEDIMRDVDALSQRVDKIEGQADTEEACREDDEEDREDEEDERGDADAAETHDDDERDEEGEDERSGQWITVKGKRFWATPRKTDKKGPRIVASGKALRQLPGESTADFATRRRRSTDEYRAAFNTFLLDGLEAARKGRHARAIQADSDIVGGYLVAPQEFVGQLIKFVDNVLYLRQKATKYTVKSAQSLGAPSLDVDIADADWTSELDTGNEDTQMAFGKRELTPKPIAKRIRVSNRLLRMATLTGGFAADNSVAGGGPEGLVRARLGYKFAVTEEKGFMTGNGANQPLGLFTASSRGIDTSRDVLTGSSTGFSYDGLIGAKYSMKQQYWKELEWLFNRSAVSLIAQLKDANGQYIWQPGGKGGPGDTLLDFPIMMSEYVPNTFTTGNYVGMLFAPRFYWIVDSEVLQIQRLVELYAAANQTGFIARMELDAMPVLAEAFTRLKTN